MLRHRQAWAIFAVLIVAATIAYARHHRRIPLNIQIEPASVEANGRSLLSLKISGSSAELDGVSVRSLDETRLRVESVAANDESVLVKLRAGVLPGDASVSIRKKSGLAKSSTVLLSPSASDYYADGMPDFMRLDEPSDAEAFRRWFTFLAEAQYFNQPKLPTDVTDCASLVRFAYREALRIHDSNWASGITLPRVPAIPDIAQYHYPRTPLGSALFRVRGGQYDPSDLRNGTFAEFADAKTLRQLNMFRVSRRIADAQGGDILFFHQDSQRSPFHAMVYLERRSVDATAEPMVVYHTGATEAGRGEVRRPTLQQLLHFPDPRWRPLPENRAFLGVYRWNILRGSN